MIPMKRCSLIAATVVAAFSASYAGAQTFPSKPIKLVVPFPPGGATDVTARILGEKLTQEFKQPVIVDNKPGAGTTIAAAFVAAEPADGHTLYLTGTITHATSAALYKKLSYDPVKSFTPVGLVTQSPFILVVNPSSKAKTLKDLIDMARANPGKITYGSTGNGAAPHLATEMLAKSTGIKAVHVPYKGTGPAMTATLAGEVDFLIADSASVPYINKGSLRALSVLSAKPSDMVPAIPSMAQNNINDIDVSSNVVILAPAGTPKDVVVRINAAINKALANDDVKTRLAGLGQEVATSTPDELGKKVAADVQKYVNIVKEAGINID
jgi:tripartite-type tricarboxylate transporter receptor subunit TctC